MNGPELVHLPLDCGLDDILEASDRDGGVIIEGWLSDGLLERFNDELEPWLAAHGGTDSGSVASDDFLGRRTRRIQGLLAKAPSFLEIMLDERLLAYAAKA